MGNYVNILGRMTKDADLSYTNTGMAVARFSVALDRGKDKDGNSKGADFPSCVAFGKTAEAISKYSGKGLRISVTGRLQTGKYEDKNGTTHYTTDVVADRIEIIDWRERGEQIPQQSFAPQEAFTPLEGFAAMEEQIPF